MRKFELKLLNKVYNYNGCIYILAEGYLDDEKSGYYYYCFKKIGNGLLCNNYYKAEKNKYTGELMLTDKQEMNLGCSIHITKIINEPDNLCEKVLELMQQLENEKRGHMIKERECIKTALNDIIPNELNKINWNVKVYGKQGSYSIYVNNIKYDITDEQANKLKCFEKEYYNSDYYKYLYFQPTSFREIKNITLIED